MVRFKPGDVISLKNYWDIGSEEYCSGIILIEDIQHSVHTSYGIYITKCISGNTRWTAYNIEIFDNLNCTTYLGNMYKDKTLEVLYAS